VLVRFLFYFSFSFSFGPRKNPVGYLGISLIAGRNVRPARPSLNTHACQSLLERNWAGLLALALTKKPNFRLKI
jgi:hypothetical protein